jgi:hypothetical protein
MTHTLLRTGDIESQKEEFCWLVHQTKGANDANCVEKALEYIAVVELVGGDNWGDKKTGSVLKVGAQLIKENLKDNSHIGGVFSSREKTVEFIRKIIAKDLGLSVIISGVLPEIAQICSEVGIVPNSANFSLGIWGRKEKLPDEKTLSITTMCGHHTVPRKYVEFIEKKVDAGIISPEEGAQQLASFCYCGMFNPVRCADILSK